MDWSNLIKLIPLIAGSVNPRAGEIAAAIEALAESEIARLQVEDPSKTREQVIEDAAADWDLGLSRAQELRKMGHENE